MHITLGLDVCSCHRDKFDLHLWPYLGRSPLKRRRLGYAVCISTIDSVSSDIQDCLSCTASEMVRILAILLLANIYARTDAQGCPCYSLEHRIERFLRSCNSLGIVVASNTF